MYTTVGSAKFASAIVWDSALQTTIVFIDHHIMLVFNRHAWSRASKFAKDRVLNLWQSYGKLKIAIWHLWIASLYGDYMEPRCIGKSHKNNSPTPTYLTNHYGKILFLFWGDSKISLCGWTQNRGRISITKANFWKTFSSSRVREIHIVGGYWRSDFVIQVALISTIFLKARTCQKLQGFYILV